MKRKTFLQYVIWCIVFFAAAILVRFFFDNANPVWFILQLLIWIGPLFHNGFIFRILPRSGRNCLTVPPRQNWMQCTLYEALWVVCVLAYFFVGTVSPKGNGISGACTMLPFQAVILLMYVYGNVTPGYVSNRNKVRGIFVGVSVFVFVWLVKCFVNIGVTGVIAKSIDGFILFGALLVAWAVSVFIGYRRYVKAFEYGD